MGLLTLFTTLLGALKPEAQNGCSLLGTLSAPALPLWLPGSGNGLGGPPWGGLSSVYHNPYTSTPNTGATRKYDFNITRSVIAPDGYQKSVILVNGQFPGPTIEANWGDNIQVTVHNNIGPTQEGTAIHWHGFLQTQTPWEDGVPGVSQCPIAPGQSHTYTFRAELAGTSWYHSHYSAQYSGGLFGPIVIHGPSNVDYDVDLGPITVSDWWHPQYFDVVEQIMAPGFSGVTFSDNNLINGKMNFSCSTVTAGDSTPCTSNATLSKFQFQAGKTHRLRFINSGSEGVQRISIDGHNMTVFMNDFVEIKPYTTSVVTLGVGQRVDVLVTGVGKPGEAYWLRSNMTSCSLAKQPNALAAVYYNGANSNAVPDSKPWNIPDPGTCLNDDLAVTEPLYTMALPAPSFSQHMDVGAFYNESQNFLWTFGGVTARVDYNDPTLLALDGGKAQFDADMNVLNFGTNSSVRFIINNPTPSPHPIHVHGVNMYVLAQGLGNYTDQALTRTSNPMRRDVAMLAPFGYLVLQLDTVNPGVWPFHCHIAWHASAGFFAQLVFQPDKIAKLTLPNKMAQTCQHWSDFTSRVAPDQIDSGL